MSVNFKHFSVKAKKTESTNVEEFLVERYESLILKLNLLDFISRWVFVGILFIGLIFVFIYRDTEIIILYSVIPVIIGVVGWGSIILGTKSIRFRLYKKISKLEKEIIKIQLEKEFQYDESLKSRVEDFYIKFNVLTGKKEQPSENLVAAEFAIYFLCYWITVGVIKGIFK